DDLPDEMPRALDARIPDAIRHGHYLREGGNGTRWHAGGYPPIDLYSSSRARLADSREIMKSILAPKVSASIVTDSPVYGSIRSTDTSPYWYGITLSAPLNHPCSSRFRSCRVSGGRTTYFAP